MPVPRRLLRAAVWTAVIASFAPSVDAAQQMPPTSSTTSTASIAADLADPRQLTPLGERLLFVAYHPSISQALFSVSSKTGAIEQLSAVSPGYRGAFPSGLVRFNDSVYFAMNDGRSGLELWASDGTAAGTRQVLDIEPGAEDSTPAGMTVFDGQLYFSTRRGTAAPRLWSTRGDRASTQPVAGAAALGNPRQFTVAGARLYFTATDQEHGQELWAIDRAGAAPRLVRDIRPGPEDSGVSQLTAVGNTLFFVAHDGRPAASCGRATALPTAPCS